MKRGGKTKQCDPQDFAAVLDEGACFRLTPCSAGVWDVWGGLETPPAGLPRP